MENVLKGVLTIAMGQYTCSIITDDPLAVSWKSLSTFLESDGSKKRYWPSLIVSSIASGIWPGTAHVRTSLDFHSLYF